MTAPAEVIADPGASVWEPIWNCEAESAVIVDPAKVITGVELGAGGCMDCVLGPTMTAVADEGIEYTTPEWVIAEEPGAKVTEEPMTKWDEESAVIAELPIVMTAGGVVDIEIGLGFGSSFGAAGILVGAGASCRDSTVDCG